MKQLRSWLLVGCIASLNAFAAGCGSTRFGAILAPSTRPAAVTPVALLLPAVETSEQDSPRKDEALSVDALVAEVLARNPSLAQMIAAWQAASARYPQMRAPDDAMVGAAFAPASFGSNIAESGYRVEIAQKIPFPGKLRLRGDAALAEASAASNDIEDMRVQLVESTKMAYYDFFLADRAIAVNETSLKLLKLSRDNADARLKTPLGSPQEVLQADVEIAKQRERGLILERMRNVAIARINALRSLPPTEAIAKPPQALKVESELPPVEALREMALAQRADLRALEDRIRVEQAALGLARREYWPDAEIAGGYDTIMGNGPMRDLAPQVSVRMNVPLQLGRRRGAILEAEAKILQKQAELDARINQVRFQIQEAYEQLKESVKVVELYEKTILPRAEENVKAADKAYIGNRIPFMSLIEAQRTFVSLQDRNYEAIADYFRRLANLERALGAPIHAASPRGPAPN